MFKWMKSLWDWLRRRGGQARRVAERVAALSEWALPAVEMVARLTPNPTDDIVVAALKTLGYTARQILESSDDLFRDAARQRLAMEIMRRNIVAALASGKPIRIGDITIRTIEDVLKIDKTHLLAAIHAILAVIRRK